MNKTPFLTKVLVGAACFLIPTLFAEADEELSPAAKKNMTEQVQALHREKQNRTPAQKKMDSHLVHAAKEKRNEAVAPGLPKYKSGVKLEADGSVLVDIEAKVSKELLATIQKKGGKIINSFEEFDAIRAYIPTDQLEVIAALPEVKQIRTATEPETHAISQGDRTHRADFVRLNKNVFGTSTKITGQGIKIGLLSDSVDYLSNAQSSNTKGRGADLGPVTIITNAAGVQQHGRPNTGEGTAMLEIVYDLAPGAQLFFATGNGGKANMANNIRRLRTVYGCDIIIDDLTYADEPPFQDDVIGQAVHAVSDSGALYFSSAANSGNQNDGTSATWEGDFNGGAFIPGVGTYHRWSGTNTMNQYSQSGTNGATIQLFWSDKLGQSANDYDLFVFDNAGNVLASSTTGQIGGQDPYEWVGGVTSGLNVAVLMVNADVRYLHLDAGRGRLQFGTSGDTRGHNASIAANAFSVAASPVSRSPAPGFFTGGTNNPVETFSSDGLRLRFYDRYTNAYTPGDFTSTGGFAFQKPDITAADGVANSGVYPASVNLSPFFGTSAAAPHAGAIAALLKCYNTNLTDVEIRQALMETALDIEAPGTDRDSGFGLIMADRALTMAQPNILRGVTNLSFSAVLGTNPPAQSFTIKNIGFTKLHWTVSSSEPWLSLTPTSGEAIKGIDTDVVDVSVDSSSLGVGTHTAIITISDPEAAEPDRPIFVFVNVSDTTSPTVRITTPLNDSSHQDVPVLGGIASDGAGSGIQNNRVEFTFYQNGDFWTGTHWKSNTDAQDPEVLLYAPIVSGVWSYTNVPTGSNSRAGEYFVSSYVRDMSGNLSAPEPGITSISFKVDRNPPEIEINSPADHFVITNSIFPGIAGSASDSGTLVGVNVYLYRFSDGQFWDGTAWGGGGSAILPVSIYPNGDWNVTGSLPILGGANPGTAFSNGDYNVIAIAFDSAGNQQRADAIFTVDYYPTYTWTAGSFSDGDPNNNNNNWGNPANWSPSGPPPSSAKVIIDGNPEGRYLGTINVHGITLNGGTLYSSNINVKTLTITAGRLHCEASAQLTDNGTLLWTAGEFYGGPGKSGSLNIPTNGTVVITNSAGKALYSATMNNSGTVRWYEGHFYGDESLINNGPTGLWEARGAYALNLYPNFGAGNRGFINHGTFRKFGAFETAHQGYFNNFGTFDVTEGLFTIYDAMRLEHGSSLSGAGTLRLVNGCCGAVATLDGSVNLSGTLDFPEGNTYLRGTGNLNLTTNGVLKISAGYVGGDINISGGTVSWTGGGFDGTNTLATTVNITGNGTKNLNRPGATGATVLNNAGIINWSGDGPIYQWARGAYSEKPPVFNNLSNAVFRILTGGTPFWRDGNYAPFNNLTGALFVKSGATNETFINRSMFNNQGEIRCETGILTFDDRLNLDTNSVINATSTVRFNGEIIFSTDVAVTGTVQMIGGSFVGPSDTNGVALGRWKGSHTFQWHGGTIGGRIILETNVVMQVGDPGVSPVTKYLGNNSVLDNYGTINWSGQGVIYAWARPAYSELPSTINNRSGAVFRAQNDGTVFVRDGNYSTFNNQPGALLVKSGGTNSTIINGLALENFGELRAEIGRLEFNDFSQMRSGGLFTGGGMHLISGGTHHFHGTNVVGNSTLKLAAGTLVGNASTLATPTNGLFEWNGGVIASNFTFAVDSTIHVTGSNTKVLGSGALLNNNGYVRWTGPGHIWNQGRPAYGELPATWNNLPGALFEAWEDSAFSYDGSQCAFNNYSGATFRKTGGTNTVIYWAMNNFGAVQSYVGRIELAGGGLGTGSFFADAGARVKFTGGTYTLSNAQLVGNGQFQVDGATVSLLGTVAFGSGTPTTLEILSGTMNGAGSLVGAPVLNWTGGWIGGTQYIAPDSVFNISGNQRKYIGSATVINNAGTINWSGPGDLYASARGAYNESPSTINNLSNGVFNLLTDGVPFVRDGNYSFFNNQAGGTFAKIGGTNETTIHSFIFSNKGIVGSAAGTLAFVDLATLSTGSVLNASSEIRFAGSITADAPVLASGNFRIDGGGFTSATSTNGPLSVWNGTNIFNWQGGTLAGHWTFGTNVVMNVRDPGAPAVPKYLASAATINNKGQMNWSGSGPIYAFARGSHNEFPSTINNRGIFRIANDGTPFVRDGAYSYFNNETGGALIKSAGTNEAFFNAFILNNRGEVRADSGTLTFNDYANFDSNSVINANSLIRFAGTITMSNSVSASGTIQMDAGYFIGAQTTNGTALGTWGGDHIFNWVGGWFVGHIPIGSNVVLNIADPGSSGVAKYFGSATTLDNHGTINWSGVGPIYARARGSYSESPSTLNNFNTFRLLNDGTPFVRDGNYSYFKNHPGGLLTKTGGTNSSFINGFLLQNSGELRADIGNLEYNDATELNNGGLLSGTGGHRVSAGFHVLRGATTISGTRLKFTAGTINGATNSMQTAGTGLFEWTGGSISGDFALASGARLDITGSDIKVLDSGTIFRNRGTIYWTGSGSIFSDGRGAYGFTPATIHNENGAQFIAQNNSAFSMNGTPSTFNNLAGAIFRKTSATGLTTCNWVMNQSGVLELQSGVLSLANSQTLAPTSTIKALVSGTTEYAQLSISGNAGLNGALELLLAPGLVLTNGHQFTVVNYGGHTGVFAPLTLPALASDLRWNVVYGPTALTLSVEKAHAISSAQKLGDGQFQLNFSGPSASSAVLQGSTNLVDWISLSTNAPFNGNFLFNDSSAENFNQRFYRVMIVP